MFRFIQGLWESPPRDDAGAWGERVAATWLERERGFSVVARNWRRPEAKREEIDLVCRDGEVLVFVEVKARALGALVSGFDAVDQRKKRALRRVIRGYLRHIRPRPRTFRFDIIEVVLAAHRLTGKPELRHFENVPLFGKHFRG